MLSMTGRITRLIDDQQFGTIAAEDGQDYVFQSVALSQTKFSDLSLGAAVTFEPIKGPKGIFRASSVRRLNE
jgi:cold shock CspA family protein